MPIEITRPTADSQLVAPSGDGAWSNNTLYNCYDYEGPTPPGTTTQGDVWLVTSVGVESAAAWQFTTWQAATKTYTGNITVKVNVLSVNVPDGGSSTLYYWNGSSWIQFKLITSYGDTGVFSASIGSSTFPSGFKVRIDHYHPSGASQTDNTVTITDIWAEGTYTDPTSTSKKSATGSSY